MQIALSIFKWIAGILLGLIIVVGLCWWLIPDQAIDPEVEKFIAKSAPPPAADNAYFMVWGFGASPELDPHKVGQEVVDAYNKIAAEGKGLARFKPESFHGEHALRIGKDRKRLCDVEKEKCLAVYQSKSADVQTQTEEYKVLLSRYRKIRDYKGFGTAMAPVDFQTPIPSWQHIIAMSELVDATIARRISVKGSQQEAVEELAAEIKSWRRILQSDDWLITQMIAVATLHRKYRLASEIMGAHPALIADHPDLWKKITAPLAPADTNIVNSMRAEFQFALSLYRDLRSQQSFPDDSFFEGAAGAPLRAAFLAGGYRANASINQAYADFKRTGDLFSKSPKDILAGRQAMLDAQQKMHGITLGAIFFNPVGRITAASGAPDFTVYAFRINDLIGLSRLIDLQRRVIEGGVSIDGVGAALKAAGPTLFDPYTENPMQWDAASKKISFGLHGKRYANFGYVTLEHFM